MDLLEFNRRGGGKITFERTFVLMIHPADDGEGTSVLLGPPDAPRAIDLAHPYDEVHQRVTETAMDRALREGAERRARGEPDDVPF